MRNRLLGAATAIALCLTTMTTAMATDPASMTDIAEHWAESTISWCLEQELFKGTTDTTFEPELSMTREMFVTVLSRIEGISEEDYQDDYLNNLYPDVHTEMYSAPAINWATRNGIVQGMDDGRFHPQDPVTREQMAAIVIRYATNCNYMLNSVGEAYPGDFTDLDSVAEYALEPLASLKATGILNGYSNDDGTYRFCPQENATRAQCAAVFQRLSNARGEYPDREWLLPEALALSSGEMSMLCGSTMPLTAVITPEKVGNPTLTWVSMNPEIASVDHSGNITAISTGTAEIRAYTCNGLVQSCMVTCKYAEGLASETESFQEKCIRIFGREYGNAFAARDAYTSHEEAKSYMVTITVPVWELADSAAPNTGNSGADNDAPAKRSSTRTLEVHENIADTVLAIFEEIYNGEEQFPISDVGCYRWDPSSEHCVGLAIDINANSNYFCEADGTAIVGSHWDPENDPYSIPADGDVVRAFRKYGFTRGIYWNSGRKDYMHFSFFAT